MSGHRGDGQPEKLTGGMGVLPGCRSAELPVSALEDVKFSTVRCCSVQRRTDGSVRVSMCTEVGVSDRVPSGSPCGEHL